MPQMKTTKIHRAVAYGQFIQIPLSRVARAGRVMNEI
jgi:hypothetical protein